MPVVYFFFPETAYRSLEEMDTIFHNTKSVWSLVSTAANTPRRYGKNGEVLINYEDTEEHRRFSAVPEKGGAHNSREGAADNSGTSSDGATMTV